VFFIIAALFLSVGVMLLLATRQRRPKAVDEPQTPKVVEEPQTPRAVDEPQTPKVVEEPKPRKAPRRPRAPRRKARDVPPEPERITKEEYLRQLAERASVKPSERQHL
jgi:outer membrane biosynthesis protein TonB